ncbi:MAG: sulfite exporter TauE/SafE family protein [Methylococcaceae bacterium]|nr:sulfite exporter TauE/SafE family protein [Methylococcaceae bacterium]
MTARNIRLKVSGMVCVGCEDTIVQSIKDLPGINQVAASYSRQIVEVGYDDESVDEMAIRQHIVAKGYGVEQAASTRATNVRRVLLFLLLLVVVGGVVLWGKSLMPGVMQQITPHMGHMLLLGIGFLTGFHCIGMCGGFVVGYTDVRQSKARQLLAHFSYGFGKTLSYTTLGAGFGLLGAIIAITPTMRGIAALAGGAFLLLYGLKMLNVFSWLRRFTLRLPTAVNREIADGLRKHRSPLSTGLLTGLLLGCGPLQAMYVMAAGSSDPIEGATILALFGLGTLGPLLGFGLFASLMSPALMRQLVVVSGILVFVMGGMMTSRGFTLLQGAHMPAMMQSPSQSNH